MRIGRIALVVAFAGLAFGGLAPATGCLSAEDEMSDDDDPSLADTTAFHRHRRGWMGTAGRTGQGTEGTHGGAGATTGTPGSGGTAGGSTAAGCEVCTTAARCCAVVQGARANECTYNAATCASLAPAARDGYLRACKTFLYTTVAVWPVPPAECR